ncbi:MAG: glycosyltransferase family 2 protein, partial [Hyphomicrobium sp.]
MRALQLSTGTNELSVGVIIPAYNRPDDVGKAVASVLAQTRLPERIVLIDDGSDEPLTPDPIWRSATTIDIIRLPTNSGAAAARQAGLDVLDTTHVAFLDADDAWLPDKLARQISHFAELPDPKRTALACGWISTAGDGTTLGRRMPRPSRSLADFCSGCWYCPGSTVLMPRAPLVAIGGYDRRLRRLEDLDLFLRLALSGCSGAVTPVYGVS